MKTLAITLTVLFAFATASAVISEAKPQASKVQDNTKSKDSVRSAQSAYD